MEDFYGHISIEGRNRLAESVEMASTVFDGKVAATTFCIGSCA